MVLSTQEARQLVLSKSTKKRRLLELRKLLKNDRITRRQFKTIRNEANLFTGSQVRPSVASQVLGKEFERQEAEFQAQQERSLEKEQAIQEARSRLRPVDTPKEDSRSFLVKPTSKIKKNELGRQVSLKYALPTTSLISEFTQQTVKVSKPKTKRPNYVGLGAGGTVRSAEATGLNKIKTFFGIKEPGFKKLRKTEARLDQYAGSGDIKKIRSVIKKGGTQNTISIKGIAGNFLNTPIRAVNRPITTGVAIGSFLLTRKALGVGGILTGGQITGALTGGGIAVSRQIEAQQGGTGSRTLGTTYFIGATAVAGYGAKKLIESTKPTNVEYKIKSVERGSLKGKDILAKVDVKKKILIGKTTKGSVLQGKPYKETFVNTGGKLTYRRIDIPGGFKKPAKLIRIVEKPGQQYIKIYQKTPQGLKLLGEDFKYIDPGSTIKATVIPKFENRNILLQRQSPGTNRISFLETSKGSLKEFQMNKGSTTKVNLKVKDVFRRNVVSTDQIVKIDTYKPGTFSTKTGIKGKLTGTTRQINKPKFVFDEQPLLLKDVNLIQSQKGSLSSIQVRQPRTVEQAGFVRVGGGNIKIVNKPLRVALNDFKLGKSGSLGLQTGLRTRPKITLQPKSVDPLSLSIQRPRSFLNQGSGFTPIFTPAVDSSINQRSRQDQRLRQELVSNIKPTTKPDSKQNLKPVLDPLTKIKQIPRSRVAQDQRVGLQQETKLQQTTTPVAPTQNTRLRLDLNFPTGTPGTPRIPPVKIPKFSLLSKIGKRQQAKSIKGKSQYRPSLEALSFNIKGAIPKKITPFSLRPLKK